MLTEIEFYDRLAESFDVMTEWSSRLAIEMPYLEATLSQHHAAVGARRRVRNRLHTIALTQRGHRLPAAISARR